MSIEKFETGENQKENMSKKSENISNKSEAEELEEKKIEEREKYDPSEKEKYWQDFWEKEKVYEFKPEQPGPLYTVDLPPPTVSGEVHIGHIFSYVQAEVITRFKRMAGNNTRYPFGLDNNGLPTERLVEKEIGRRGKDVDLEEFTKSCLKITEKYREKYENLWRSVGLSVDWNLEYSTISPEVQKLAQSTFKEFYERGLIYKEKAPALYCTECHTSFAQAEKEDKEKEANFFDLIFKMEDGEDLIISTTRPELLPACVAVFVHPKDERYKDFMGKKVETPLGQKVTIMSDDKVEIEKGTGAVMCCTYGDETDIYWTKKHGLQEKIILDENRNFQNVDDFPEADKKSFEEGKKTIIEKLRKGNFIKKEEKIKHSVDVHERCGTPVEFLSTTQWFVKMLDKKEDLLKAGDEINWYPPYMKKRYQEWVSNLKWDWCISRERFYGIPIPVFNCDNCDKIVIPDEGSFPLDPKKDIVEERCPDCKTGKLIPEKNVLDTWFTSSLTSEINNNHKLNGPLKGKMYPMSVRPQAHDIIRTWTVYSVLMGLYRHNEVPWKDLMISGHILLKKGEKISKSKGGGKYKPEKLIAEKSSDAVRYAMCGARLGKDAYFDEKEVEKGRKLVIKIYNATKLLLNKLEDFDPEIEISKDDLEAFDKWIVQKSFETAEKMTRGFEKYEFSEARRAFEDFFWSDFCDNYLEIAKERLSIDPDDEETINEKKSAQYAAYHSLLNVLKMAAPFIPHITEDMYHAEVGEKEKGAFGPIKAKKDGGYFYKNERVKSIHNSDWPFDTKKYFEESMMENAESALFLYLKLGNLRPNIKLGLEKRFLC